MKGAVTLRMPPGNTLGPLIQNVVEMLYRRGDLGLVQTIAGSLGTDAQTLPEVVGWAARAAARMGNFSAALEFSVQMREGGDSAAAALEGYCLARSGLEQIGEKALARACASEDQSVRIEAAFRLALAQWTRGALSEAERTVERYLPESLDAARTSRHEMLGWIEVARIHYRKAGEHFRAALAGYDAAKMQDEWLHQRVIQALTLIAYETLDFELVRGLEFPEVPLGAETSEPACFALQNRAWLELLAGCELDALDLFQRARALASTPSLVAIGELNLATYHRVRGGETSAKDHLQLAYRHLREQDWAKADADERIALLEYAIEAYYLERFSAGAMLTRYFSTALRKRASLAFETDSRVQAFEATARGVLDSIVGRKDSAASHLIDAVSRWRKLGFRYREAISALLLHDVSASEAHLDLARRAIRGVPRSFLAREVACRQER
jgi:hypothetical protein